MEILVSWPGPLLVHLGVLEMSFTIFGCYIIAVSLGHVPAWLPMISDCALYAPEKYIFRLGIVIGSFLIGFLTIGVYYTAKTRPYSKQICLLGVIGSFGLSVVGVVNEHEDHTVHVCMLTFLFILLVLFLSVFAAIFFACYDLYMVLTTASFISMCKSFHELCSVSYFVKVLCCIIGCISGIGYILCCKLLNMIILLYNVL